MEWKFYKLEELKKKSPGKSSFTFILLCAIVAFLLLRRDDG
jgi:hypothetical protein